MIDFKEAQLRKVSYNIGMIVICVIFTAASTLECVEDILYMSPHLIYEALGLIVLCVIYFSTIVELIRKLRIFVLEETKLEANLIRL